MSATRRRRWRTLAASAALAAALPVSLHAQSAPAAAPAAAGPAPAPAEPPLRSALDAPLFYQLLIGEMELRGGQPAAAFEILLDAARRTRDEALFRRAVDIALQGRAGDRALAAARAWRTAVPQSRDALRMQLQILSALGRLKEAGDPLRALIDLTPGPEQPGLIAALPRFLARGTDARATAELIDGMLAPFAERPGTRVAALVAMGRGWQAAGDTARALTLARAAHAADAAAPGPVLLAVELLPAQPAAEGIVTGYLGRAGAEPALRLAWVRALAQQQRYPDAIAQLESLTRERPDDATPWLTLGALQLEMKHPREAEAALQRYVELATRPTAAAPAPSTDDEDDDEADGAGVSRPEAGLMQAYLMLAQAAEQRGDFKGAEGWLAKVDDPQRLLEVQTRRASLLARQGRIAEARETLRRVPERGAQDARAKAVAEASVMRDAKRWQEAYEALAGALQRSPDDSDLLYEQAMMAEKLDRLDEMERLLRRVIELKPDNPHAYNALGYSLADRNLRLPEAKALIQRALELAPGDPFITDSLGWVEWRLGNRDEALRLLQKAYATRPDAEIAAHLGEVLWAMGRQDEARRVWTEAKNRDAANEVLRETLARLKVGL